MLVLYIVKMILSIISNTTHKHFVTCGTASGAKCPIYFTPRISTSCENAFRRIDLCSSIYHAIPSATVELRGL